MTLQTLERKVAGIKAGSGANPVYKFLVEKFPPLEIRSASEHRSYSGLVDALMRELGTGEDKRAEAGIRQYLSVLAPLIEKYEHSRWPAAPVSGRDVLAYLMELHGLSQSDLVKEIGAQPYVSDILRGKKALTSEQIRKLSKRFGVSPAVFFP